MIKQHKLLKGLYAIIAVWLIVFIIGNVATFSTDSSDYCGYKSLNYIFLNFRCMYLFEHFIPELEICEEWEGFFRRGDCSRIDDEYGMCYFDGENVYTEDGNILGGTGRCSQWRERTECEKGNPSYIFEHTLTKVYYDNGIAFEYNDSKFDSITISGAKVIKEEGGEVCRAKTVKDMTCSELKYAILNKERFCPKYEMGPLCFGRWRSNKYGTIEEILLEHIERCVK